MQAIKSESFGSYWTRTETYEVRERFVLAVTFIQMESVMTKILKSTLVR